MWERSFDLLESRLAQRWWGLICLLLIGSRRQSDDWWVVDGPMRGCHTVVRSGPAACWTSSPPPSLSLSLSISLRLALSEEPAALALTSPRIWSRGCRRRDLHFKLLLVWIEVKTTFSYRLVRCLGWSFWPLSPGLPEPVMCWTTRMTISKAKLETMILFSWNFLPHGESFHALCSAVKIISNVR